jgi:hypothetical protein
MRPKNCAKNIIATTKKMLWSVSLVSTFLFLFLMRHDVQSKRSVDAYFMALEKQDFFGATQILNQQSLDESYLNKRMQKPMSIATLRCGMESAVQSEEGWEIMFANQDKKSLIMHLRQKFADRLFRAHHEAAMQSENQSVSDTMAVITGTRKKQ